MLFSNFLGEVKNNGKAIENYTKTIKKILVSQDPIKHELQLSKLPSLSTLFYSSRNIFEHHIDNR